MEIRKLDNGFDAVRFDEIIYRIPPEHIKRLWDDMGKAVGVAFPIAQSIKMPLLAAFVLSGKEFGKLIAFVREDRPSLMDEIEWGHRVQNNNISSTCINTNPGCWQLFVNNDFINAECPLEGYVIHEMAHVYEQKMLMQPGTLTKKFGWL